MSRYIVHYQHMGQGMSFETHDGAAIADFKEGFWLNAQWRPALASECKWWIPPSQLLAIRKLPTDPVQSY